MSKSSRPRLSVGPISQPLFERGNGDITIVLLSLFVLGSTLLLLATIDAVVYVSLWKFCCAFDASGIAAETDDGGSTTSSIGGVMNPPLSSKLDTVSILGLCNESNRKNLVYF